MQNFKLVFKGDTTQISPCKPRRSLKAAADTLVAPQPISEFDLSEIKLCTAAERTVFALMCNCNAIGRMAASGPTFNSLVRLEA